MDIRFINKKKFWDMQHRSSSTDHQTKIGWIWNTGSSRHRDVTPGLGDEIHQLRAPLEYLEYHAGIFGFLISKVGKMPQLKVLKIARAALFDVDWNDWRESNYPSHCRKFLNEVSFSGIICSILMNNMLDSCKWYIQIKWVNMLLRLTQDWETKL